MTELREEAAVVAERAAGIIERQGHCKKVLQKADGSVCLWGALFQARTGDAMRPGTDWCDDPVLRAISQQIVDDECLPPSPWCESLGSRTVDWNNAPERTGEDVILALKRAAAGLREGGKE